MPRRSTLQKILKRLAETQGAIHDGPPRDPWHAILWENVVYLTDETKYEQGADGAKAAKGALREGQHVMVSGHKLASGKFAASEVMIHADPDGESKPHGH